MMQFPQVRPAVRPAVRDALTPDITTPQTVIAGLFAAGQQGFWLPFTDFASLTQDSAGTLPYTALEQPVGLILDKSKGGGRGPELSPNGGTFDDAAGWTITQPTSSISGGVLNVGAGACDIFPQTASVVVGKSYEVTFTISNSTANYGIRILNRDIIGTGNYFPAGSPYITANGSYRFVCVALSNGSIGVNRVIGHTGSLQVDNFSVKEIPGNHASQPTSTARGVVSARVNLLTKTNQIGDGVVAWGVVNGLSVTLGASQGPRGSASMSRLTVSGGTPNQRVQQNYPTAPNAAHTVSLVIKKESGSHSRLAIFNSAVTTLLVSTTIVWTGSDPIFADNVGWISNPVATNLGGGNFLVSATFSPSANTSCAFLIYQDGSIGDSVLVGDAEIKPASQSALPYQRVNTPTDYDAVGFPKSLRVQVDDFYTCGGGGSTTGFYYADVIRPMGGAGTRRVIWSDRSGNNGYELAINTSDKLELSAGNGTTITAVASTVSAALAEGKQYEVMDDGTNLSVQIDGSAPVTVARPVVTAGSSTITLYRGASTGYFNGNITEPIYRAGPPPTAYERSVIRGYQMQKAGL